MQQVATELRLLTVMQRQEDVNPLPGNEAVSLPPPPAASIRQTDRPRPSATPNSASSAPIVPLGPTSFGSPKPKLPATPEPAGGSCPKCECAVVYVSRAHSSIERFLERMNFPLVRCHRCYHRYVVIGEFKIPKNAPIDSARKFRPIKRHN
jgi:hypothetical protein